MAAAPYALAEGWPQWFGTQRDGVWHETGLIEKFPKSGPKTLWHAPLGTGYSGPAVEGNRVYVMDRRRAMGPDGQPQRPSRRGIPGTERIVCLDAKTGRDIWHHEYDCAYTISYPSGPRTTPVINEGRVYCLGAMGNLVCLNAADGSPRWSKKLVDLYKQEVPLWGYASHPLIDGDLLYCEVGGPGSAIVAFNKRTGAEVWKALTSAEIGYSPPMIYELGGKRQLVVWLSDAIYGLDPATGKQFWMHAYPDGIPLQNPAVNIITVKKIDDMLFLSTYYNGPMMLRIDAENRAVVAWKGTSSSATKPDGAHCLMATPVFKDGYGYAIGNMGELRCFKAKTGEKVWQTMAPLGGKKVDCGTVFIVPQGDRFVMLGDQGDLIFADLSPQGYKELDRAHILDADAVTRGRNVVWSHPAFADGCIFARNDREMVCVSLAKAVNR